MAKSIGKALFVDAAATETLDTLYPYYRLQEANIQPVVIAPERRLYQMVLHEIRPGQVQQTFVDRRALVVEQVRGFVAQDVGNTGNGEIRHGIRPEMCWILHVTGFGAIGQAEVLPESLPELGNNGEALRPEAVLVEGPSSQAR